MSNYTKSTNFATKDNLTPGDPLKIVRGTEIDTEFNNIATAIATKTDNASAAITGGSITGITDLAIADGGTGASTATAAINNLLPSQTSNANKYLQTDGTNVSWDAVSLSTSDITGTLPVANGGTGVTSSTGTGSVVLSNSPTLVTPALGTPASGVATNLTGLPLSTGVTGTLPIANGGTGQTTANAAFNALAPSQATASGKYLKSDGTNTSWDALDISTADITGTLPVANGGTGVTTSTGTGSVVLSNSPTLVTPALGTPSSATLTNATGLPISTGVSGLGTGVATALAVNVGSAGAPVVNGGALGTPSSGTVTNLTGTASININGTVGATTPTTGAFTTLSASSTVTLSGGTANGVTYLNGSKVLTSGSALTFDGTSMSLGSTSSTLGLGTTTATSTATPNTLYLGGTYSSTPGANAKIRVYWDGTNTYGFGVSGTTGLEYITSNTAPHVFFINGSEQMRLTSTGLGIGTSSPSGKLHVVGAQNSWSEVIAGNTTSGQSYGMRIQAGTTSADYSFLVRDASNTSEYFNVLGNGNVGIGTSSPAAKLHIVSTSLPQLRIEYNSSYYTTISNNGTFNIVDASTGNPYTFQRNGSTQMILDTSGNLGLGVTPSAWSSVTALEMANGTALGAYSGGAIPNMYLGTNCYYDGDWKYKVASSYRATRYTQTSSGEHQWYNSAAGTAGNAISFTQAMTLDGSGNLGVGITSPAAKLDVRLAASNGGDVINIGNINGSVYGGLGIVAASPYSVELFGTVLTFRTGGNTTGSSTERARIDSSGNFLVYANTKETRGVTIYGTGNNGIYAKCTGTVNYWITNDGAGTGSGTIATIYNDTSVAGSITVSGTTTAYVTSSDYRLKENVQPMTGALDKVAQLKPVTYTWKADGASGQGFIAHELQAVAPDCVVGEKDAVDEEGNIKPQGIDTSFLVATLTAAIQELKAEFDAYKASHP